MTEPVDTSPVDAGAEPATVGRVEFHRGLNRLERAAGDQADALIATAGWACVSLACWLLFIGYCAIRGQLRGRP